MKFTSIFTRNPPTEVRAVELMIARREIEAYLKHAFAINYVELKSAGLLNSFMDASELLYNETLEMLKDTNHSSKTYFDEKDKKENYMNVALSIVFQDISNKLVAYDYS